MDSLSHSMIVGVYKSPEIAKNAINELIKEGFSPGQVHVRSKTASDFGILTSDESAGSIESTYGLHDNIKGDLEGFFHGMTDGDSKNQIITEYAKVLEEGDTLVSVDADNDVKANKAASLMARNATVASEHTATSPSESDESDTGSWSGVRIFKDTKDVYQSSKKK